MCMFPLSLEKHCGAVSDDPNTTPARRIEPARGTHASTNGETPNNNNIGCRTNLGFFSLLQSFNAHLLTMEDAVGEVDRSDTRCFRVLLDEELEKFALQVTGHHMRTARLRPESMAHAQHTRKHAIQSALGTLPTWRVRSTTRTVTLATNQHAVVAVVDDIVWASLSISRGIRGVSSACPQSSLGESPPELSGDRSSPDNTIQPKTEIIVSFEGWGYFVLNRHNTPYHTSGTSSCKQRQYSNTYLLVVSRTAAKHDDSASECRDA